MTAQKFATGTEAASDALQSVINRALGFPLLGVHIGGGAHVAMPPTWDNTGPCPPGWTKHAVGVWKLDVNNAGVPIPDGLVPSLQAGPSQARLTGPEQATLATAIASRANQDLDALNYAPKPVPVAASVAVAVAEAIAEEAKP